MKYSIKKPANYSVLFTYENGVKAYRSTPVEKEFWGRIQELETCLKYYAENDNWNYHNGPFDANGINFEGPNKAINCLAMK